MCVGVINTCPLVAYRVKIHYRISAWLLICFGAKLPVLWALRSLKPAVLHVKPRWSRSLRDDDDEERREASHSSLSSSDLIQITVELPWFLHAFIVSRHISHCSNCSPKKRHIKREKHRSPAIYKPALEMPQLYKFFRPLPISVERNCEGVWCHYCKTIHKCSDAFPQVCFSMLCKQYHMFV